MYTQINRGDNTISKNNYIYQYVNNRPYKDNNRLYTYTNTHLKKPILSLLLSRFTLHFVFYIHKMSLQTSLQTSLQI